MEPVSESVAVETFGGRIHVEWDPAAAVTALGQLPFFIEFLKVGNLFEPWVEECPLSRSSPNAPRKADVLGTLLLSILAGHQRYAHITSVRGDGINPALLGMSKVVSEDSVRRSLLKLDEAKGVDWLQAHLERVYGPLLGEPWFWMWTRASSPCTVMTPPPRGDRSHDTMAGSPLSLFLYYLLCGVQQYNLRPRVAIKSCINRRFGAQRKKGRMHATVRCEYAALSNNAGFFL